MDDTYDVWQDGKRIARGVAIEAAAAMADGMDEADAEWAIETYGRADDGTRTIKRAGSRRPAPYGDWHMARAC